jgi:2'-5' RNA ligase
MPRCFLGLCARPGVDDRLAEVRAALVALPPDAARRVRVVPPANYHLTLKFLGPVADTRPLIERLGARLESVRPFAASLAGLGAFPSTDRPRAVFAKARTGEPDLVALAELVDSVALRLGFAADERPRVPHLTVARIDDARPRGPLSTLVAEAPPTHWGELDTSAVVLFESQSGGEHSRYLPLHTFTLAS